MNFNTNIALAKLQMIKEIADRMKNEPQSISSLVENIDTIKSLAHSAIYRINEANK